MRAELPNGEGGGLGAARRGKRLFAEVIERLNGRRRRRRLRRHGRSPPPLAEPEVGRLDAPPLPAPPHLLRLLRSQTWHKAWGGGVRGPTPNHNHRMTWVGRVRYQL